MALTPWEYADKTGNEHAHQVALFMWSNMAARFGFLHADEPANWTKAALQATWGKTAEDLGLTPRPQLELLHAIKNQGHGDAIRGAKSRAEGVRAGVPDTLLPVPRVMNFEYGFGTAPFAGSYGVFDPAYNRPHGRWLAAYHGLYIELKRPDSVGKKAGKADPEQIKWQEALRVQGYAVEVCVGWLEARACLIKYLTL